MPMTQTFRNKLKTIQLLWKNVYTVMCAASAKTRTKVQLQLIQDFLISCFLEKAEAAASPDWQKDSASALEEGAFCRTELFHVSMVDDTWDRELLLHIFVGAGVLVTHSGRTNIPCRGLQRKYSLPFTVPSCFP